MKNLTLPKFVTDIFTVVVIAVSVSGCTKVYKAEEVNAYRDAVPNPPPTEGKAIIGNFTPQTGIANTVVTLSGINIDPNVANNSVTVNGVPAPISAIYVTAIPNGIPKVSVLFTIPANATTGKIVLKTAGIEVSTVSTFTVKSATVSTFADLGANYIEHMTFDRDGNVFGDNIDKIIKISPAGAITTVVGGTSSPLGFIWGIASNSFSDIYVPDATKHNIYRLTSAGKLSVYAGNGIEGIFDGIANVAMFGAPKGMAVNLRGDIYVSDVHRIRKISSSGVVTTLAGSDTEGSVDGKGAAAQFGNIDGIAVDSTGNIYVSDRRYLNIRKITPDGIVTTLSGTGTAGFTDGPVNVATFNDPRGIAVDGQGNVYVADQNKNASIYAIRVVNQLGGVTTLIKGTSNTGVVNGPAATATVNSPNGLAFDASGSLYIVNTGANIISKVAFK
jgi:sugar lactone lactonase YvrE